MLFSQAAGRFLEHCRSALTLSLHTQRAYDGDLQKAANFWPKKHLRQIDKEDLRRYIRHQREVDAAKESSIKRRIATLKLLFRWAVQESCLDSNPFDKLNERIRLPRRLPRALDRDDAQQLKKQLLRHYKSDDHDTVCRKTAIHLLLETGVRVSELTSIRVEDLSLSDCSIKIHGKGNRQRMVYFLSPELGRNLRSYLERRQQLQSPAEHLLLLRHGHPLTPPKVRSWLREAAQNAGISRRVTPHMLRHTCATHWLAAGLDIRFVQKLLGHHSIATTEIYTHVSDQGLKEALRRVG